MSTEAITSAVLALPAESRAALVEVLMASLEPPIEIKYREEWEREIEDRIDAYRRGEMKLIPREDVIRKLGREVK